MFALKWSKYSYLFANELIKFKAKDSEIVATPLCLGNVSKDFPEDNTKRQDFMDMIMHADSTWPSTSPPHC